MPIVEQSPVHHHTYSPKTYYPDEHITDQTNTKMQLTLILPNGVPSVISVDANTPMMDLLVQAASLNKLNPSGYSLVVLDSNQHVIHFKANQTVGQIGSSMISLLPKEPVHTSPSPSKTKTQPFEITVRLQINLPDAQKILIRVDPTLPLHEIKEQICKQKKYTHSNEYTLRLPNKLDQPLALGLSLAECKTNELTLVHNRQFAHEYQTNTNEIQSFDRLYRTRSESQPPNESLQDVQNQQLVNNQLHPNRSSTLRPSHTSLHAYWNDPNFDTQSQISNCSSTAKKRRAPRPPSYPVSNRSDPQMIYVRQQQSPMNTSASPLKLDHHQSQESLQSENTKRKRKAPVILPKKEPEVVSENMNSIARPTVEPPAPPVTILTNTDSPLLTVVQETPTEKIVDEEVENTSPMSTKLSIMTDSLEGSNNTSQSPSPNQLSEPVQVTPPTVEQKETPADNPPVIETPKAPTPVSKPPRQNIQKEKKSSTIDGLVRVVDDHAKRSTIPSNNDDNKQTNENISYFRVAKSRFGKFETDNQGFVNNSIAIFDSTNQSKPDHQAIKASQTSSSSSLLPIHSNQGKSQSSSLPFQTKGKQAYNLLKKYEKQQQSDAYDRPNYFKEHIDKEKSPTPPVQVEVVERTTHITVTVESDHKEVTTLASPVPPPPPPPPPVVAPKPSSKTITEYRTIRRIGGPNEEIISKRKEIISSVDSDRRSSSNSASSHDELMEAIRQFGGLQNLKKK